MPFSLNSKTLEALAGLRLSTYRLESQKFVVLSSGLALVD